MTNWENVEVAIVALDGEFDLAQRGRVNDAFDAVAGHRLVIVDLERASYIDSTVLSSLVRLRNELAERGGALVVTAPQPMVKRLLQVAGMDSLFDIRATLEAAREQFGFDCNPRRLDLIADVIDS